MCLCSGFAAAQTQNSFNAMNRERLYKTEAVILKRTDFGEADRLLTVYTPDYGKLRLIAKGIRKPTSRKAGHLELFNHARLLVAKGRELDIVTQAETVNAFRALREDLVRTSYAHYVAELLDKFTAERDKNRALFNLLLETLTRLCEESELDKAVRYYEIHLLTLAGYRPELFVCVKCRSPLKPVVNYFSPADGGILCPRCGEGKDNATPISVNALKVLRFMQTREYDLCRRLNLSRSLRVEIEAHLRRHIVYYLEKGLKSVEFILKLREDTKEVR